jgi:hypothetical protein
MCSQGIWPTFVALLALMRCCDGLPELHAYEHALRVKISGALPRAQSRPLQLYMILLTRPKAVYMHLQRLLTRCQDAVKGCKL